MRLALVTHDRRSVLEYINFYDIRSEGRELEELELLHPKYDYIYPNPQNRYQFSYAETTSSHTQRTAQYAKQQTISLFSKNLGDQHSSIVTSKVRDYIDN
jgi:hypothetical protein